MPEIISFSKSTKRIAVGFSVDSWELMQRLLARDHVDFLALPEGVAANLETVPKALLSDSLAEVIRRNWSPQSTFIFVGAVGVVVRIIAPFIDSKENDPAVVVMDARAKNIIPLLGGHIAGAEEIAFQLSEDLGGSNIETGFSATNKKLPIDSFGKPWGWKRNGEVNAWKKLMVRQAKSLPITFVQNAGSALWQKTEGACNSQISFNQLSLKESDSFVIGTQLSQRCTWCPPVLWIGIGCERNTSLALIQRALADSLKKAGLTKSAIAGFATLEIKSNEKALKELVAIEEVPIHFHTAKELAIVSVPNPSEYVFSEVGTPSVAEAASLISAGKGAKLKLEKQVFHSSNSGAVTIAIAESREPFAPHRGELHLVGSGPGELSLLTHDARFALARSVVWLGYKRYLDLLEPLRRHDQVRINGSLTFERDRCEEAINLAMQGIRVSLISSGDCGIYGMAGLALELLLELPSNSRPDFHVHPGITALQLAAARIGAPLMHDFCAISLSDCLTSWKKIEERIKSAAKGDFVIAMYNPKSKNRNWQVERALEILRNYRDLNTPVLIARQLGRKEESLSTHNLEHLPLDEIDMLTILLIGNSSTFLKDEYLITPRGYQST